MLESYLSRAPWLGPTFALAFGLLWGSFVNVVIYRLPLKKSVVRPRSSCLACGKLIAGYDNIPVISYLLLKGRCRHCQANVSLRYPLVELLVGTASLVSFLRHGVSLEYLAEFGFVAAMVALVFIDYDHRILPNAITIPGTIVGLLLAGQRESISLTESVSGAVLGAGLLLVVAEAYFRWRKIEGLGMGDVKMMGMVGAFLGWKAVLLTLFLGSFLGSVVGLIVMRLRGGGMQTKLPFGTFLGMAAAVAVYAGGPIIRWYTSLY